MNILKYIDIKYDKISIVGNTLMRSIRDDIRKINSNLSDANIILTISNILKRCLNFQGISKLLAVITDEKNKPAWNKVHQSIDSLFDEIFSNTDLYVIIKKIKGTSYEEIKFINYLIKKFELYGCNLSSKNQTKLLKIKDVILQYSNDITTYISSGPNIEYTKDLIAIKSFTQKTNDNVTYIPLTYQLYKHIQENIDDIKIRKYINDIFTKYVSHILPKFIKLNIYRNEYTSLLGYPSFSKFQENTYFKKLLKEGMLDKIHEIITKTLPECIEELKSIQEYGKNTIYNINYGFTNKRKKILDKYKIDDLPLNKLIDKLIKLLAELFDINIKENTDPKNCWNKNTILYTIDNSNIYIDITTNKNNYADVLYYNYEPPCVAVIPNIQEPYDINSVIELTKKLCIAIFLTFRRNKYVALNIADNDELNFIVNLIEIFIINNLELIIYDSKKCKKMTSILNIHKSFDIIYSCVLSIIDNYLNTNKTFIDQCKILLKEGAKDIIDTISNMFTEFIKNIFEDTPYKIPKAIQPNDILELNNGYEGKLYVKIINKVIAFNIWNKYKCSSNNDFFIQLKKCFQKSNSIFDLDYFS